MSHWITFIKKQLRSFLRLLTQGNNKPPKLFTRKALLQMLTNFLVFYSVYCGLAGFFVLKAPMEAVVMRAGEYHRTVGPGIHWHLILLEKVYKLEIGKAYPQSFTLGAFTSDANLVNASIGIEYSIKEPRVFLLGMKDTREYFSHVVASSVQRAIARYPLASLFSNKTKLLIQKEVQQTLKEELSQHPLGINLLLVTLPALNPPGELKKDFDALQKATNEAKAVEYKAKLKIKQLEHETELAIQSLNVQAHTAKYEAINKSKIETSLFLALLPYYEKNPEITLQRLQCEKTEKILKNPKKILLIQPKGKFQRDIIPVHLSLDKSLLELTEDATVKKESAHAT